MEEKIKKTKDLIIKANDSEKQIKEAELNDDGGRKKQRKTTGYITTGLLPPTKRQTKARAKNKRAKQGRNINHKSK